MVQHITSTQDRVVIGSRDFTHITRDVTFYDDYMMTTEQFATKLFR